MKARIIRVRPHKYEKLRKSFYKPTKRTNSPEMNVNFKTNKLLEFRSLQPRAILQLGNLNFLWAPKNRPIEAHREH